MSDADQSRPPRHTDRPHHDDAGPEASPRLQEQLRHQVAQRRAEFEEANERITERAGRNLILASAIGIVAGAVTLVSVIFATWGFLLFAVPVAVLGIFELSRALQAGGRRVDIVPQVVLGAGLVVAGFFVDMWVLWVLLLADIAVLILWRLLAQTIARDGRPAARVWADALTGGFVQIYVAFLAALAMVILRQEGGEWWILAFLIVVVASDTGAYAAGLSFGKHPMAPRISPKKTWEGFGGAAFAALLAGVLLAWLMLGLPWWTGLFFGAAILITATVGDLGESMLKRDLGVKDMSSWLPGHGGVLDRLDSILPSVPAALALYYLLSPWGTS